MPNRQWLSLVIDMDAFNAQSVPEGPALLRVRRVVIRKPAGLSSRNLSTRLALPKPVESSG